MPHLTEEDLIGSVEEAAELQSMLGSDTMRERVATPPPQPSLGFAVATVTSTHSDPDRALEQLDEKDTTTSADSSASSSQEQAATTNTDLTTSGQSAPSTPKKRTTTKRKSTITSSPKLRSAAKRKSRTLEDDDDYRAPSTPRSKARRSRVVAKADNDKEYGPPRFASRTMTRQVRRGTRYSDSAADEEGDKNDERSICLASCDRAEDDEMLGCSGGCEKQFHAPCVGFRSVLPDGRRWLCFECRKEKKLGMRSNGIVAEGDDGELVEVAKGSRMEEEWRRDGWMV